MFWYYMLKFFGGLLTAVFSFLPVVEELPFGLDNTFSTGMGYYESIALFFPPFSVILTAFLAYLSFKTTLIILRLFKIIHV